MLSLSFRFDDARAPTVLCLGAHSDDIEIGACATILGLAETYPSAQIVWVVFAAEGPREAEARGSAEQCVRGFARAHVETHRFSDGLFPSDAARIKAVFEALKAAWRPDIILTHQRNDLHQDHRQISDLTWQTFRNHLILEYEIPKYDGDFGSPNLFYPVSDRLRAEKLVVLSRFFESQRSKSWFSSETFEAVMRLRGIECASPTGFAEAFYCRKARLLQ